MFSAKIKNKKKKPIKISLEVCLKSRVWPQTYCYNFWMNEDIMQHMFTIEQMALEKGGKVSFSHQSPENPKCTKPSQEREDKWGTMNEREIPAGKKARKQRYTAKHGSRSGKESVVVISSWNAWNRTDKKPTFLWELYCQKHISLD